MNVNGLTNFAGTTLTGGSYEVLGGTLRLSVANIVNNAAAIVLDGASARIQDMSNQDALRNLANNTAAGNFTIRNGAIVADEKKLATA